VGINPQRMRFRQHLQHEVRGTPVTQSSTKQHVPGCFVCRLFMCLPLECGVQQVAARLPAAIHFFRASCTGWLILQALDMHGMACTASHVPRAANLCM
jgi:hypothetical protein